MLLACVSKDAKAEEMGSSASEGQVSAMGSSDGFQEEDSYRLEEVLEALEEGRYFWDAQTGELAIFSAQPKKPGRRRIPEMDHDEIMRTAREVAYIVNRERNALGIKELWYDDRVGDAAMIRAEELMLLMSHDRPDGRVCGSVLDDMRIRHSAWGENIAFGHMNAQEVVQSWMGSEGHRENILNPKFRAIGVGVYQEPERGRFYWVQLFIR
jgi:uncharacterized protein YkwD